MINVQSAGVLMDVEGTTSSVKFVYDVMFPFARRELGAYLAQAWDEPACRAACEQIAADAGHASLAAWTAVTGGSGRELVEAEATRLMDAEPGVEVELVATDAAENLLRREADIAIRMFRPVQADLIAKKVTDMRLGLFAAERYVAAKGEPTLETFADHRMVGYDRNPMIVDWMRSHGMPPPPGLFRVRTDDQIVHWRMVVAGAGIGPNQLAVGAAEPTVRRVLSELTLPTLPVWLTVHEELRTSALIRRVYDFLAAELSTLS